MANFQICPCSKQPGYPHAADCPYPYFGHHEALIQKWQEDRANLRSSLEKPEGIYYAIKLKQGTWHQAARHGKVWKNLTSGQFVAHCFDVVQIAEIYPHK